MRNILVVANWKMNPRTLKEAKEIARASDDKRVVVCPPFIFLEEVKRTVKKGKVGAQNCFWERGGKKSSFTGEVSPGMLKDIGCKYVIVGHSERRTVLKEEAKVIKMKVKAVLAEKMTPILCVGEKKEKESAPEEIKKQLKEALQGVPLKNVIIAYEPVFAIGTGKACPVDLAEKRKLFIKSFLAKIRKKGEDIPVLYGGSVDGKNASSYVKAGFDGLLVGGASTKPGEFERILKKV